MGDPRYRVCAICHHNRPPGEQVICSRCEPLDEFVLPLVEDHLHSWMRQVDHRDLSRRQADIAKQEGRVLDYAMGDYRQTRQFIRKNLDAVIDAIEGTGQMEMPRRVLRVVEESRKVAPSVVCRYLRMVRDGEIEMVDMKAYDASRERISLRIVSGLSNRKN